MRQWLAGKAKQRRKPGRGFLGSWLCWPPLLEEETQLGVIRALGCFVPVTTLPGKPISTDMEDPLSRALDTGNILSFLY